MLLTTRLHAAIIGAWMRSRVVCIERSEKIRALANQLGLQSLPLTAMPTDILTALGQAKPVPREILDALATTARSCCDGFFENAGKLR